MLNRVDEGPQRLIAPLVEVAEAGPPSRIAVSGDWVLASLDDAYAAARAVPASGVSEIDVSRLHRLDTAGALAVLRLQERFGPRAAVVNARAEHAILLNEVARAAKAPAIPRPRGSAVAAAIGSVALATTSILRDAVRLTAFLGAVGAAFGRVIANPKRFRGTALVHQLQQVGFSAVPIIALVCFLIGGVVMQQGAQQLRSFGAETLAIDMLGILTLREVGVILAAVMVAGRSASAFTAQIGTMKMREEIDAMRTIGIDPIETLVLPRILALIIAMPLLVFVADIAALAGGAVMAGLYLDLDLQIYLQRLNSAITERHFWVGMIKAPFVALVIGLVGCLEGLSVEGSAESVGSQVTTAVVKAIFLVLVLDGMFAIFLSAAGF